MPEPDNEDYENCNEDYENANEDYENAKELEFIESILQYGNIPLDAEGN